MFAKELTVKFFNLRLIGLAVFWLIGSLFWLAPSYHVLQAQPRVENTIKFGAMYFSTLNAYLKLDNKTTGTSALNSNSLTGVTIYGEKITQSYFGYEVRFTPVQQEIIMTVDSAETTVQNTGILLGGSMRAYLKSHKRRGFNVYGAVNIGLLTTQMDFVIAPTGLKGKSYSTVTYVIGAEAGFDYLLRFAGVRAAAGYQYGGNTISTGADDIYRLRYTVASPYWALGVFSFF
ncbi:MAG: hypothetical protein JJV97_03085 [SAR324 cluster bacterium]|nr:hypothetical protein [SAR324 cluster bacterium]